MKFTDFLTDVEFFSDKHDSSKIYAEYHGSLPDGTISKNKNFVSIDSPIFESYLRLVWIQNSGQKITARELIQEIRDRCFVYGNPDRVVPKVRMAGTLNDFIEYDLADYDQNYVRITADGWKITKKNINKFLKRTVTGSQVKPVITEKSLFELLRSYVNTDKKGLVLFTVWLVQAFCQGNHSALLIMAEKGSGKTTLTKIIRKILDPSQLNVSSLPSKNDDFVTLLTNAYMVAFDNLDTLNKQQSDILCIAITGATIAKIILFQTNELGVYELHNTVVLNGIDIMPTESDLAERCLLLNLKKIEKTARKLDRNIEEDFDADLPEILGAIFETLSKAMQLFKGLNPAEKPRMADSHVEMLAIALALGVSESDFNDIYFENLNKIDKARSSIAIVEAVKEYMYSEQCKGRKFSGKASEVYTKIRDSYSGRKQDLPSSASRFSRKLMAEHSVLYSAGLTVNIDDTKPDATYIDIIKKK